jgi:hypothetical protein
MQLSNLLGKLVVLYELFVPSHMGCVLYKHLLVLVLVDPRLVLDLL